MSKNIFSIKTIQAREILDSRGNPTVECSIKLKSGAEARASVPSGVSVGKFEALELRDCDQKRYHGKGVLKAVSNIEKYLAPILIGKDSRNQDEIDQKMLELDGTNNKSKYGANSILAISLAIARVASLAQRIPLWEWIKQLKGGSQKNFNHPKITLLFNLINGGAHADNKLEIQEFWFVPKNCSNIKEAVRMASEVFHDLINLAKENGYSTNVGDEGGIAPNLEKNTEAIELILRAGELAGYKQKEDFVLGLDVAASSFFENGQYMLKSEGASVLAEQLIAIYNEWSSIYPLKFIEDGLDEEDWVGWKNLTQRLGKNLTLIGDDLLATNPEKLQKAIQKKACNAILIKLNQIGTLTETLKVINLAQANNFQVVVSHRSGETADDFIADLAIGASADAIKTGAPCRGERVVKYNRLMEILEY